MSITADNKSFFMIDPSIVADSEESRIIQESYIFDGFAGADPEHRRKFRVINELPSQNLFIRDLLIRPTAEELATFGEAEEGFRS